MTSGHDDVHWIEVVDAKGQFPVQVLGPYANARMADRAYRGVMRLLNVKRYTATVVSQRELAWRDEHAEAGLL